MNDSSNNASPCHTGTAQLLSEATDDFSLVLTPFFAELVAGDIPDKVRVLRFSALREVQRYLAHYRKLGIVPRLLCAIARKKGELISGISTKAEMERVVHPHVPHYDGNKFVPNEYMVPEEELICWSETSLRAPLNDAGFNRYVEHPDNVCYGDNYFMELVAAHCQKIAKVDEPLYFYRVSIGSTTRSYNNPIMYDRVKSAELMLESLEERGFLNKFREEIEFRFVELFYVNSINAFLFGFRPAEINEIRYLRSVIRQKCKNYRKNKYFKERISKRNKLKSLLCDISPFLLCKSCIFYHNLKEIFKRNREETT